MFPSSSNVHFIYNVHNDAFEIISNFKYKLFFNASIPLSTNFNVAPLNSSPLVFFESNKGKVLIIVNGDPIRFANGASTSSNLNTSRIDHVDLTIDERGEKVIIVTNKKWKAKWELNQTFQDTWAAKFPWAQLVVGPDGKVIMV